ncbi:MAG: alpha/beta hydrolase [bacterium]|nr:alpha/beta hydrolase [bacterium]
MKTAYSEYGDRRNPAILFLHGIRLGRDIWARHARSLVDRYHVVAADLPGHGALANVRFAPSSVRELLDRITGEVCTAPPLVVGYSLGGYVSMNYAVAHPDRTRALLLAGCTLDFVGWKHWPYEAGARFITALPAPLRERFLQLTLHATLPRPWAEIVEEIPFDPQVLNDTKLISRGARFSETIAAYRKPVLIANGELDLVFRMDERRFLNRLPQARLRVLKRVDHTAPLVRAEEFTAIVREFADRVFTATSRPA